MTTLYELTSDYKKLLDNIYNCDEITADHSNMIGEIKDNIENKCKNIASVIKNFEHLADGLSSAIENMVRRESSVIKKINWLKDYLLNNLIQLDVKEIKTTEFDIRVRENRYHLDIERPDLIEKKYIKHKETYTIDRQQIIRDLKSGIIIEGAEFKTNKSLVIN